MSLAPRKPDDASTVPPADLDPFRATGDAFADIPLGALDPAPWNPKKPIHGKYREGLLNSLRVFGQRDHLKVWANPRSPGRYYALDGNQRLSVLVEWAEESAGLPAAKLSGDPEAIRRARSLALQSTVGCRILADLDPVDAQAFTAAFDRNHAVYDEAKQSAIWDVVAANRERSAELMRTILRPAVAFVPPPAVASAPPAALPAVPPASDVEPPPASPSAPTADAPWGAPPPPPAEPRRRAAPAEQLIPYSFSLTRASAERLERGLLLSKSRVRRSDVLLAAVERLAEALGADGDLDDAFVEWALGSLNDRMAIVATPEEEQ